MPAVKISCFGAGGRYFGGVLRDLACTEGIEGSEIRLYDIAADRAELMAKLGERLAREAGAGLSFRVAKSLAEAADGADFAVTSIGGTGGAGTSFQKSGIHRQDLVIPAEYGIYQLVGDTCGPAGLMTGLRNVPVHLEICRALAERSPDAVLFNHSNPMSVLCRAMTKHGGLRNVVGICHGVQGGIRYAAEVLGINPTELDAVWVGTNHYLWFTRLRHGRKDVYPELRRRMAAQEPPRGQAMTAKLSEIYGYHVTYPRDDHAIEFYPFLAQLRSASEIPYGLDREGHGPDVMQAYASMGKPERAEPGPSKEDMLAELAASLEKVKLPADIADRAPPHPFLGETLGASISAIAGGRREVHIVNIPNMGAVPNLPEHAVLEVEGVTDSCGFRPVYTGEAPVALAGMLQKRIAWQELAADAGAAGDRNLALQALLVDEMAIPPERAEEMLDRLLESSREHLPQFFPLAGHNKA